MSDSPKKGIDFAMVLASSVHDMKNSVGMLLASLDQLMESAPPKDESQSRQYSTLSYEASRINNELVQLLTVYRMQNEFLPLRIDEHYIVDIFEEQIARNHTLIETRDISLDMDCDHDLNWYFDRDLVSSVIHNVLINGIRYTSNKIVLSAKVENDMLVLSVADNGSGYPPSMLDRPSCGVEDAEVSKDGTHLGLYFAERIAEMHKEKNRHGFIKLSNDSDIGGGLFSLYIP
ncbi:sensor histidine kinase [Saccharophagus degradans]|uniref:histidine kinase n=2 Tax=Saccharophagus degradans TaxID=86304 RepID=Q21JL4_SACD2|nr:HAMP domain-containing sensor histidine kinase [Saccharophagus degradans]ABD81115.1 signal transduction histidine kinase [Saccharophagus degradans 2-40]MBU2985529.1 HAMP domain-containing histidine kinase [Saccharophagus degradans]MDO6421330.1 HAMP domain-containing sensor histidine kinase [Saccharophagus degradans]MDO6605759.1 HAMP domain-containing sensor histidine kinase [Saccharophagus degradans]WGO96638.1 HAMP domain-containing sensor histidine kinase [Saccharophagus degradans]